MTIFRTAVTAILLTAVILLSGCSTISFQGDQTRELHPGHPGHEVH